jgi:hypothetical protein
VEAFEDPPVGSGAGGLAVGRSDGVFGEQEFDRGDGGCQGEPCSLDLIIEIDRFECGGV